MPGNFDAIIVVGSNLYAGGAILPLAPFARQPHNVSMAGNHPFSIKIEQDLV
jgi:hypothetical protein